MRHLSTVLCSIAAGIVGYWLGRDHENRLWERACEVPQEPEYAVQPADPWPPIQTSEWRMGFTPVEGRSWTVPESWIEDWSDPAMDAYDATYLEADALAAIRRHPPSALGPAA